MTDDERREWLANLRPGDRVAFDLRLGWLRGCILERRLEACTDRPEDRRWLAWPDSIEDDEPAIRVWEASMRPLPYSEWAGILIDLPKPEPPRVRRRPRRKAQTAAA
jgi:hypothetical protein